MKKQFFILVILVVAVFASVTKSYGQAIVGFAPRVTITAPDDKAMTPIAGKPYDYSAIISPLDGMASWYATKSTTFMTATGRPASIEIAHDASGATGVIAPANYITPTPVSASPSTTSITWSGAVLSGVDATANPLFVVVEYTGPATGCANNNIKVMQIVPIKNAFTIDLTNMTHDTPAPLAYEATESQCYAGITSSTWAAATGVTNIYGVNTLYFELVAANFYGGFKPQFQLSGLHGTQTADIAWSYTIGGSYTPVGSAAAPVSPAVDPSYTSAAGAQLVTTALTNTSTNAGGAAIYIKVTVHNNGWEGLANNDITLAVDAVDNAGDVDVDDASAATVAAGAAKGPFAELAKQTLKLRPTVTEGTGVTFVTQVP